MVKLFYKIDPAKYTEAIEKIPAKFNMYQDVDEEKTILNLDGEDIIEQIVGSYNPVEDDIAKIRVVLVDESLREYFDSVLGEPYRIK
ncbi:MAG: hypothetical protein ACTSV2_02930 [Candidatus Thorarchaeota archaeon]